MKKLFIFFSMNFLLLVACDNVEPTVENQDTTEEPEVEKIVETKDREDKTEVEEVILEIDSEQPLENIGEYKYTRDGRVELLNIIRPTDTYTLTEGVYIKINDIKIMHHSEIPESEKQYFRDYFGFDEEGYTIQIVSSVENTTDETIGGIEPMDIVTSSGNQYNLYNNGGPLMNSVYEVRPNATANFVGVSIAIKDPEIIGLTLYYQPHDADGYHLDESKIEIPF